MQKKQVNIVWSSMDYDAFSFLENNREIDMSKVKSLMESMKAHPLEKPMDVNEKFQIIDGQHRFTGWKMLKRPVIFIIHDGWSVKEVPVLNTNQKNWNPSDFLDLYCSLGKNDYLRYKEFNDHYGFSHRVTMMLLANQDGTRHKDFNEGNFKITKWTQANLLATEITSLKEFYEGYKRAGFVAAYMQLHALKDFKRDVLIQKLRYQSRKLVDCVTVEEYLDLIREIYNYKAKSGTPRI